MMHAILPTCREVARTLAEGGLKDLPWHGRLLLRLHLGICAHCARFARQMGLLSEALKKAWTWEPGPGALDSLKSRILARLRKA